MRTTRSPAWSDLSWASRSRRGQVREPRPTPTPVRRLRLDRHSRRGIHRFGAVDAVRAGGSTDAAPRRARPSARRFTSSENEPVAITVVNRMAERTAVHWHGIELESYYDGVAGIQRRRRAVSLPSSYRAIHSSRASRRRARAHSSITRTWTRFASKSAGLAGALIVHDGQAAASPATMSFSSKGARDPNAPHPVEINGTGQPGHYRSCTLGARLACGS